MLDSKKFKLSINFKCTSTYFFIFLLIITGCNDNAYLSVSGRFCFALKTKVL